MAEQSFNPYAGYDFDKKPDEELVVEEEQEEENKFFNPYAGYDFDASTEEQTEQTEQTDAFDPYAGYDFSEKATVEEPQPYDPDEYDLDVEKSFDAFAEDKGYMDSVQEYAVSRYGDDGKKLEDETNEQYLDRFLTHIRAFENNSIDLTSQLDWIRGATEKKNKTLVMYIAN